MTTRRTAMLFGGTATVHILRMDAWGAEFWNEKEPAQWSERKFSG